MTDTQAIRTVLISTPLLTAEEIAAILGWTAARTRKAINKLMSHREASSVPRRYEITSLGAARARHMTITKEERAEKRRQYLLAYNNGRRKELAAERREQRRREKAAKKQAEPAVRPAVARVSPAVAFDATASNAIASRHPLAMAWGGQA